MVVRSNLLPTRAGYRSARPVTPLQQIQLATHGRPIELSHERFRLAENVDNGSCRGTYRPSDMVAVAHSGYRDTKESKVKGVGEAPMVPYRADQVFAVVHDVFCYFAAAIRITLTALPM